MIETHTAESRKLTEPRLKGLYRTYLSEDERRGSEAGVIIDESVTDDGGGTLDLRKVESEIRAIRAIV